MPAYNFKKQFAPLVESGVKNTTIRPKRKRPTVKGDKLVLYTAQRTKYCRKLKETVCKDVQDIFIDRPKECIRPVIKLNGHLLGVCAMSKLALMDGFAVTEWFIQFFENQYGLPFNGDRIKW